MSGKNTRLRMSLSLSLVALSGTIAGVTHLSWANAGTRTEAQAEREAQGDADKARAALTAHKAAEAAHWAEQAVALRGDMPAYRALLGQSYLASGRFASAEAALKDALSLAPGDGGVALNLALAQIGAGNWASARRTLDTHAEQIPPSDRGLAIALAGDPTSAVDLLTIAARAINADAKARQNLALAYALSGRWAEARAVAAVDLSPADLDGRMAEWAAFAKPAGKADQVAALLGVKPANDLGMPIELALGVQKDARYRAAAVDIAAPAPVARAEPASPPQPVKYAGVVPAPAPVPVVAPKEAPKQAVAAIIFGPRQEVVQALPATSFQTAAAGTARHASITRRAPSVVVAAVGRTSVGVVGAKVVKATVAPKFGKGDWYVQLGAFENAAVAHDAWARATHRFAGFRGQTPFGKTATVKAKSFYRLALGGFDRSSAVGLCDRYRARHGVCFVRAGAGDQVADWAGKGEQVASR